MVKIASYGHKQVSDQLSKWLATGVSSAVMNTRGRIALNGVFLAVALFSGCHSSSSSPKYKYLQQGQTQIRIDQRSRRTDRLTNDGWVPISFASPSVDVPKDQLKRVSTTLVAQDVFDRVVGTLCYEVYNNSDFVLKDIWVELPLVSKSRRSETKKAEDLSLFLPLSSQTGGFAPVGNKFVMCYDGKDDVSQWDAQLASVNSAQGWKQ